MKNRLAKLALLIGRECALKEFEWMKRMQPKNISNYIDRRIAGEPLQYILGTTPFGPLDLLTRPPTLIPRPETEDWALRLARDYTPSRPVRVLDFCTGSGCIPLLLCHLWPPGSTRAVGVDISPDAIRLATDNTARSRARLGFSSSTAAPHPNCLRTQSHPDYPPRNDPVPQRQSENRNVFTPLLGDLLDPDLFGRLDPPPPFDVITANPPYIPLAEYHGLCPSVKDYEDPRALIGDLPGATFKDGLSFYRIIAALLARGGVLATNAIIALEVGHNQAHAVQRILHNTPGLPLAQVGVWKDPWNKARVVFGRVA
ncbi:S-adenosyl-L-methionine-dependent methyltransferase [Chiua virens]|nr:S-adenosyl-L-methionine-dependent methyltransferase [Chiua virens]